MSLHNPIVTHIINATPKEEGSYAWIWLALFFILGVLVGRI